MTRRWIAWLAAILLLSLGISLVGYWMGVLEEISDMVLKALELLLYSPVVIVLAIIYGLKRFYPVIEALLGRTESAEVQGLKLTFASSLQAKALLHKEEEESSLAKEAMIMTDLLSGVKTMVGMAITKLHWDLARDTALQVLPVVIQKGQRLSLVEETDRLGKVLEVVKEMDEWPLRLGDLRTLHKKLDEIFITMLDVLSRKWELSAKG